MYRKDSIIIEEWLKRSDKALLVTGARQIGKTWLIREEIAKSGYRKFEVNFIDQPDLVDYLNVKMSANEFLVKLKRLCRRIVSRRKRSSFLMRYRNVRK